MRPPYVRGKATGTCKSGTRVFAILRGDGLTLPKAGVFPRGDLMQHAFETCCQRIEPSFPIFNKPAPSCPAAGFYTPKATLHPILPIRTQLASSAARASLGRSPQNPSVCLLRIEGPGPSAEAPLLVWIQGTGKSTGSVA